MAQGLENTADEWLARTMPPPGYENHVIVDGGDFVYFKRREDWTPEDGRVFYDGDMRDVLLPDDPRVKALQGK